ncbi:MAG: mechanosensitive ion channel domain-containing protein [bacterium]
MTEKAAITLSEKLRVLMLHWGMNETAFNYIVDFSGLIVIFLISILVYYITKFIINRILKRLIQRSKSKWDDYLYEQRVFTRVVLLIPALILQISADSVVTTHPVALKYLHLGLTLYITFVIILVIVSFLNAVYKIYGEFEVSDSKPIKGYIQIGKIITFVVGGILVISILVGRSPLSLLAGLGAMSAVLMLIFKDSILGFVAGVQLSSNRSLQIGDWITAPKYNTDGTVFDISLVTVKVRNFDNSVSLIPTYTLITDSFLNWRSMGDAGGRRLKRSFLVDVRTIRFAEQPLIDHLKGKELPVELWLQQDEKITNLGLFRQYLAYHLRTQSIINQDATLMIRQLQPTENGLPVEVYAFYRPPDWSDFEHFQSALFEHIFATLPDFGLAAFQRTSSLFIKSDNV